jgi:hypothetical protein
LARADVGITIGAVTVGAILMSASTIVVAPSAQTLRRVDLTPEPLRAVGGTVPVSR